jgi:hypothetical protein
VDYRAGSVPPSQGQLYSDIEEKYPALVPEILETLFPTQSRPEAEEYFRKHFQLECIDIRGHIHPSNCVLHYRTDLEFDWYVRVSGDFHVEFWGERD